MSSVSPFFSSTGRNFSHICSGSPSMPASFCIFDPTTFMTPQAMKLSPPTRSSLSTSITLWPASTGSMAADMPAMPVPRMRTSVSSLNETGAVPTTCSASPDPPVEPPFGEHPASAPPAAITAPEAMAAFRKLRRFIADSILFLPVVA